MLYFIVLYTQVLLRPTKIVTLIMLANVLIGVFPKYFKQNIVLLPYSLQNKYECVLFHS